MQVMIPVSVDDLAEAFVLNSRDGSASDLILKIDLAVGDAGFTEGVIKRLAQSLRGDTDDKDWAVFTAELGAMKP